MDMVIGLVSLVIGAFASYYVLNKKLLSLSEKNIQLKTTLDEKEKNYAEKLAFVDQLKSQVNTDFKSLASDILKNNRDKLKDDNSELLTPLQTELKSFRERIESITRDQLKERATLGEQIKGLHKANLETQQTAQDLTNALTYDNKHQGNWGEVILNSMLTSFGFREGHEFDTQKQLKSETGETFQPDVVLHLPDEKDIVIDSKVSLKDYKEYISDTSNEDALDRHLKSIENQIKNISIKEYENLEGVKTLDFILVFIPIEGALLSAYNKKQSLHSDALKKNVLLVSPSSLSMSLKLVNFMWQTAKQNKNSEEIARQAGAMYDKLALFVEELDRVEGHLDKAKDGYSEARKKLATGKGNLISRAEKIKTLGVAPKKELSE